MQEAIISAKAIRDFILNIAPQMVQEIGVDLIIKLTSPVGDYFFREQALFRLDFVGTINSTHVECVVLMSRV